jgi:ABC-type multidrug transport system ATPase subunit
MNPRDTDDEPCANPLFDFDQLAKALASTVQREREAAFVLGLHGPWGAGKTTLLRAITVISHRRRSSLSSMLGNIMIKRRCGVL